MKALLAVLLAPMIALAAEQPSDFAFGVPVEVDGSEALYEIDVPASVYQGTTRGDLGDLRVFNADGEPVPFALEPRPPQRAQTPRPVAVKYFPLYGEHSGDLDGLRLKVEKSGTGTVVSVKSEGGQLAAKRRLLAYLVDVSALKQPYEALELDWHQASASYATSLRVEASDDLKSWTTVAAQAPLLRVEHDGQRLEQHTIEFQPRTAKYLRLSWPESAKANGQEVAEPLELTRASVRTGDIELEPERSWKDALPEVGEQPGEYFYDLGGQFPVERMRFSLPQENTIARVELLSRPDSGHEWQAAASGVIYRLTQKGHKVTSPDLAISPSTNRYWLLRVDQKGGGLGSGLTRLSAGWVPQKLVFAARGNGPFLIAYGSSKVQPAAYPIDTVVPGWRGDQQPRLAHVASLPERLLGGAAALHRPFNYRVFVLWGALVLGVLLLGWMAWRLGRQMQRPSTTEATGVQKAD